MFWIFFSSDLHVIYRCKCKRKHKNKNLLSANFTIINKTGWFEDTKYISYPFCRSIHHDGFPSPSVKKNLSSQCIPTIYNIAMYPCHTVKVQCNLVHTIVKLPPLKTLEEGGKNASGWVNFNE